MALQLLTVVDMTLCWDCGIQLLARNDKLAMQKLVPSRFFVRLFRNCWLTGKLGFHLVFRIGERKLLLKALENAVRWSKNAIENEIWVPAVWKAFDALEMNPWIGPNDSASDGGGIRRKFGISGNFGNEGNGNEGNDGNDGNDNPLAGNTTGTGIMIGDFFNVFTNETALAILAIFNAFNAFNAPSFKAIFFFAIRNGAVNALIAATFAAFAYKIVSLIISNIFHSEIKTNGKLVIWILQLLMIWQQQFWL